MLLHQFCSAKRSLPCASPVARRRYFTTARASTEEAQTAGKGGKGLNGQEINVLRGVEVRRASDGQSADLSTVIYGQTCMAAFLTHLGDFDSWEYAQKLRPQLDTLEKQGAQVVIVAIGSVENGSAFCRLTEFPAAKLWMDPTGAAYKALGFEPGLQLEGQVKSIASPYVRLMAMCAGIGSPGTLNEVFRGYLGDREAEPVWKGGNDDPRPIVVPPSAFGILGQGYQRPFELATLRLLNMMDIIPRWEELKPVDDELILQRGGTLVFHEGRCVWRHRDAGILGYADVDEALRQLFRGMASDEVTAEDE